MSAGDIDTLVNLWAASLVAHNDTPPFANHSELYATIDATPLGDVPWESFTLKYNGEIPVENPPPWMVSDYDIWFRDPREIVQNLLSNADFDNEFDYSPLQEFDVDENHRYQDFMSGNWAWKQAVSSALVNSKIFQEANPLSQDLIAEDPETHGAMFVPIILGSDKTTVSVATGNNEYWPVYLSIGNIHNNVRRAHRNGVVLLGFLSIPKSMPFYLFAIILLTGNTPISQLTRSIKMTPNSENFGGNCFIHPSLRCWSHSSRG